MRFTLKIHNNIQNLMRQAGYYFEREEDKELVFARPLGVSGSGYPRFHIYLNVSRETAEVNLHLDQKKPVYGEMSSHNAEYQGELIEKEVKRIKEVAGP